MANPRALGPKALVTAAYSGLAVLFTYPLVLHIATRYPGEAQGDGPIYIWNLWWVKTALVTLHQNPLRSDFIFFPTGIGLALHTLALLHGLLFIPLSAAFGQVVAANLIVLGTFLASALGAYALARHVGASREGAFLAGLLFAFSPPRLSRLLGHYDLLSTEWIPLFALAFLKVLEARSSRPGMILVAGLLGAACGYTDLTYLAFLVLLSSIALLFAPRGAAPLPIIARGAAVALVSGALLAPLLLEALTEVRSWHYPPYPGSDRYVSDLLGYLCPGPRQTLLGATLGHRFDQNATETVVFVGWVPVALVLTALLLRPSPRLRAGRFWLVLGSLAFVLSLGDSLHVLGRDTGIALPFRAVSGMPWLQNLRAPSRFSILVALCLAMALAAAWTRLLEGGMGVRGRVALTGLLTAVIAAEFVSIPTPLFAASVPALFESVGKEQGDFTVAEIPGIDQVPAQVLFHQTFHKKRVFIGTAARVPSEKTGYFFGLPLVRPLIDLRRGRMTLEEALSPEVLGPAPEAARFLGLRYVVVDRSYEGRGLVTFLERALPIDTLPGDDQRLLLRIRPEALPGLPSTLEAGSPASRLYYESGWKPPRGQGGSAVRGASSRRSTLLFRRTSDGPLQVTLDVAASPGADLELRFKDHSLGRRSLRGPSEQSFVLPSGREGDVERLELLWSAPGTSLARVRLAAPGPS